jgi:imidazolonepropionase-like amidohydrolase
LALMRLRELLEDARLYGRQRGAYDRRALREMDASRLDLERLQDALAGRIPVVVRVSRASDILRVLELARSYGLSLVLSGAEEGWRVADRISAADVPVILQPLTNLPSSFTRLGARFDNAAILARAGVPIVLTTDGAHELRNIRQEAGNAIAHGLPREEALRAVTLEPARVFGLDREYGTIAPGKVANVVVWNGDPFETTTWPTHVFVQGREVPLRSRQTELFERYRRLDSVSRGINDLVREREFTRLE